MNRFLVFAVLAIAAFATAAWGDNDGARSFTIAPEISRSPQQVDGGGIAFEVKNIQVEAEWDVMDGDAGLTIDDNGVLTWPSDIGARTVVVTVIVEDNFSKLNDDYVNLAASAIITINFFNPRIYMIAGYNNGDVWSSANGKDWEKCGVNFASYQSFATAVFKGKIYTFGGRNTVNSTRNNRVLSNDDCDQGWGEVLADGHAYWDKRQGLAVAVLNDTLFLTGGYAGSTRYRNDVWSSTDGAVWAKENSTGLGSRYAHRMLSFKGTLYISGGSSSYNNTLQDVLSSGNGVNWTQIANQASLKRQGHGFVAHKGKFYIIGGSEETSNGTDSYKNDVWSSVDGATWTIEQNATIGTARGNIRAVSMNGKIYIMGGLYNSSNLNNRDNSVWSSTNGTTWTIETSTPGWTSRFNYGAVIYN